MVTIEALQRTGAIGQSILNRPFFSSNQLAVQQHSTSKYSKIAREVELNFQIYAVFGKLIFQERFTSFLP